MFITVNKKTNYLQKFVHVRDRYEHFPCVDKSEDEVPQPGRDVSYLYHLYHSAAEALHYTCTSHHLFSSIFCMRYLKDLVRM